MLDAHFKARRSIFSPSSSWYHDYCKYCVLMTMTKCTHWWDAGWSTLVFFIRWLWLVKIVQFENLSPIRTASKKHLWEGCFLRLLHYVKLQLELWWRSEEIKTQNYMFSPCIWEVEGVVIQGANLQSDVPTNTRISLHLLSHPETMARLSVG